jgi:hypothetical protein
MCKIPKEHMKLTKAMHMWPKKHEYSIDYIHIELWNQFEIEMSFSALQRFLNPNDPSKLPADLVGPICTICDNDFSFIDLIKIHPEKIEINCSTVAKLTKEAGEAITELAKAIEDGHISHDEKQSCIKELLDLKQLVSRLLARLVE